MRLWRLSHKQFQTTAFTGEGTFQVGGRWVPRGHRVVYASRTLSLCVLESLVHMDVRHMKDNFVAIHIDVPPDLDIETVEGGQNHPELPAGQKPFHALPVTLPRQWHDNSTEAELQGIGAAWLESRTTCLLCVPSVIVPQEANFLINPIHPDFQRLTIGVPETFQFDSRLVR